VQLLETGVECSLSGWVFWLPSGSFVISRRAREWSINSINRAVNEAKNIEWEEGKATSFLVGVVVFVFIMHIGLLHFLLDCIEESREVVHKTQQSLMSNQ